MKKVIIFILFAINLVMATTVLAMGNDQETVIFFIGENHYQKGEQTFAIDAVPFIEWDGKENRVMINPHSERNTNDLLGLQDFYGYGDFYNRILKNAGSVKSINAQVNPYVEPHMGWKTGGKPAVNPTKVASEGLSMILNGDLEGAKKRAQWLLKNSSLQGNALFFPFLFDFSPYWPYNLKAPWNSALTQGLSLGLFTYLYKETGEEEYFKTAHRIYNAYLVPVEQGGFTRFEKEGPFFEEYPTKIPTRVLNGAAVAMLALHDYAKITGDEQARQMFLQSVDRLGGLLPGYEVIDPDTGIMLSSYSLAPGRAEVLGRFVGEGDALVMEMKLIGIRDSGERILSSVQVGSDGDDDSSREFYVWPDKRLMNWGEPINWQGKWARQVNARKGEYNHSPFKFVLPLADNSYQEYAIEMAWLPRENEKIDLQLYDEKQYWSLGRLLPGTLGERAVQRFTIPPEFVGKWRKGQDKNPKIDEKYLDANQMLIELIGKLSGSKVFSDCAQRWKNSRRFVPAQYLNRFPPPLLVNSHPEPVLGLIPDGDQSKHVEYPSAVKINGQYFMYYCAYGDDNQWRLFLATSEDGLKWKRHGWVFGPGKMPENCRGNQAFPFVIENKDTSDPAQAYLLYFAAASQPGKSYDRICLAYSADGWHWKYGGTAIEGYALDPLILLQPTGGYLMFYTTASDGRFLIKKSTSDDGYHWSNPVTVTAKEANRRGLYTISGLYIENKLALLLQSSTPAGRNDMLLYQEKSDGTLAPVNSNPVVVDRDWENRWNAVRYGYNVIKDGEKYVVYYNGIPYKGAEAGGQIGWSELNINLLKEYLN